MRYNKWVRVDSDPLPRCIVWDIVFWCRQRCSLCQYLWHLWPKVPWGDKLWCLDYGTVIASMGVSCECLFSIRADDPCWPYQRRHMIIGNKGESSSGSPTASSFYSHRNITNIALRVWTTGIPRIRFFNDIKFGHISLLDLHV